MKFMMISEAPMDGTPLLLIQEGYLPTVGAYRQSKGSWYAIDIEGLDMYKLTPNYFATFEEFVTDVNVSGLDRKSSHG